MLSDLSGCMGLPVDKGCGEQAQGRLQFWEKKRMLTSNENEGRSSEA